jgi:hypothetical protein
MTEQSLKADARRRVLQACPGAVWYNHQDKFTAGIPDSSVTWNYADSWLEFKLLNRGQSVHDRLKATQLVELMKLERQTGRAWVLVWRKGLAETTFYTPSALFAGRVPASHHDGDILAALRTFGAFTVEGFNHDALVTLIKTTHGSVL